MNFPRRIVGDYDVDRLQVQVWQHIQPRSTNHPFGLIPIFGIGKKSDREWPVTIEGLAGTEANALSVWMSASGLAKRRKLIVFG